MGCRPRCVRYLQGKIMQQPVCHALLGRAAEEDGESFSWQGQGMGAQYTAGFGPVRLVLKPVHKSVEAVLL